MGAIIRDNKDDFGQKNKNDYGQVSRWFWELFAVVIVDLGRELRN